MFNTEMARKPFEFSPDHIQCMCEALQQKGDIDKLATLLYNLPKNELVRPNDSILRYLHQNISLHNYKKKQKKLSIRKIMLSMQWFLE